MEQNTPRLSLRLVCLAKSPSMAFSEKADKLLMPMALHAATDDRAVVVVPQRAFFMGKPGWIRSSAEFGFSHQSTGQRHAPAERRKVRRWRAVGGKPRIVGQFKLAYPVWLQTMLAPDAL